MKKLASVLLILLVVSCSSQNLSKENKTYSRESQLQSYLWQQRSGEWRALSYQAYNLATMLIKEDLQNKHNKKRAVVFDIDETVLDNSFSGAFEVKFDIPWDKDNFNKWVYRASADAMPGAVEFINFLISNRVEPIFISNRTVDQVDVTLKNFSAVGINAKKENMLFMNEQWGKESRRLEVLKKYEIVLFIGDNLHDFNKMFNDKSDVERKSLVDSNRQDFGTKYIILPNPLYGDWEKALPKVENKRDLLITK
jgi:5'-nucleotidase (lipoprotein e(P4) family)